MNRRNMRDHDDVHILLSAQIVERLEEPNPIGIGFDIALIEADLRDAVDRSTLRGLRIRNDVLEDEGLDPVDGVDHNRTETVILLRQLDELTDHIVEALGSGERGRSRESESFLHWHHHAVR